MVFSSARRFVSSQNIDVGCQSSSFFSLRVFYPVVGDTHCHSVVEANAAVGHRSCQARHSAHFLGYSYGFVVYLVYEGVGQGEVCNGVGVLGTVVVVAVSAEGLSEAVVVVQHRSDAVEAKPSKWYSSSQYLQLESRKCSTSFLP